MPTIRRPVPPAAEPPAVSAPLPVESSPPQQHSLSALRVPDETTPTWELEMLVSGAVLFGLFQLPPLVSSAFTSTVPRLGAKAYLVAFESYLFGKAILYALIAGFVLHLASRAYWVALVGLDSVFPGGIRWERGTMGPVTREVFRARFASLPVRIERIDNFASVIFASAFGIAFLLLGGLTFVGALAGMTWLISHALLHDRGFQRVFVILLAVFAAGPPLAFAVDRRMGARLAPDSAGARIIRAAALFNYRLQGVAIHGPIIQTLYTNVRRSIVLPVMILTIFGAMTAGVLDLAAARNHLSFDGYGLLPRSGAGVIDYRYYGDQRTGDDRYATVPFIQSDVLRDPYVRLFVAYQPRRDDGALARACPAAPALAKASAATPAARQQVGADVLACLSGMRAVSLDGRGVDPGFRFFTDPQSGLKGLLGYISVDGLAKGRHVLVVQPMPLSPDAEQGDGLPVRPDSIPFRI
jgi:hypothetical protein